LILKSRFNKVTVKNTFTSNEAIESPKSPLSNQRTPIALARNNKKESLKILSNIELDPEIDIRKSALDNLPLLESPTPLT